MSVAGLRATILSRRESLTAGVLGFVFFAVTVGIEKLDPRNISWLTFKDQRAHWIGWLFFADDRWRWPLGANPRYGWGGTNSIVNTDSWPLFALIFKVVDLEVFDRGQYFGLAFAICSVTLFVGSERLFRLLGLSHAWSLVGSIIVATTPLFWWMQRWYPAMSGGLCLLVWAFVLYVRTHQDSLFRTGSWLAILLLAIATNFYLCAIILLLWLATVLTPGIRTKADIRRILSAMAVTAPACGVFMYLLGFFIMPVGSSSTGRYGVYTANLLGLFDVNSSSRLVPEIPSPPLQYEPTSLGIGAMLILVVAALRFVFAPRAVLAVSARAIRRHAWLTLCVLAGFAFSVSNYMTIGERGYNFELHYRASQLFSIFQSSVRFIWPFTVLATITLVMVASRWRRFGAALLVSTCLLQVFDVWPQFREVANRANGTVSPVQFDEALWSSTPRQYETIAYHPPDNILAGWDECALAAVLTDRKAECAYLSRASGIEEVAVRQETELLRGTVDSSTVYWLALDWVQDNLEMLRRRFEGSGNLFVLPSEGTVARSRFLYFFPSCDDRVGCAPLRERSISFDRISAVLP